MNSEDLGSTTSSVGEAAATASTTANSEIEAPTATAENNNEYKTEASTPASDDLQMLNHQGYEQSQQQHCDFESYEQQQPQQQYFDYNNGYQQQQQWQQYQQQPYPPTSHHEQQHMQQSGSYQGYGYGMYQAPYNGGAMSPNGGVAPPAGSSSAGPHNATPSPTTNSDDSGGDCVNEPKRMQLASQMSAMHQEYPQQQPQHQQQHHVQQMHQQQHHMAGNGSQHPAQHSHHGHAHYYSPGRGVPMVQKRPRQTRRSKKKRDPNEPQKPVSAYALFFRDMQAGIKARNPNASFGEVSKHVASMWDNLNPDHKNAYKKKTENAKKEYLKQLAAYRANLVSKSHGGADPYSPYGGLASYYKSASSTTSSGYDTGSAYGSASPAHSSGASSVVRSGLGSPSGGGIDPSATRDSSNGVMQSPYHSHHQGTTVNIKQNIKCLFINSRRLSISR